MKNKNYLDFGDIVILKKENVLKRMAEINHPLLDGFTKELEEVHYFNFELLKNKFGMLDIIEYRFNKKDKVVPFKDEEKILRKSIFHFVHLGLAEVKSSNLQENEKNTIKTKVKISNKIKVSDGDLFSMNTDSFIEILNSSKMVKDQNVLNFLKEALKNGLNKVMLSFHYEDSRESMLEKKLYDHSYAPNPYSDMVVDIYITNNDMSYFGSNYKGDDLKGHFEIDEYNYQLVVDDYLMEEKDKYALERIELNKEYSERYTRSDFNTIMILSSSENIDDDMIFLGNFQNLEKDYISTHDMITKVKKVI